MSEGRGNVLKGALALTLSLVLALLVVELIPRLLPQSLLPAKVRAVQRIYDARDSWKGMMRGDAELGFVLLPDLDLEFPSEDRTIAIRTAALDGFDIGHRQIGTSAPYDAVALGDSFTFCDDSTAEDCWVRRLGEMTGLSIATLGVNGYSNLAEARLLKKVGPSLAPKLILVGFFPNDFKDNLHFRNWTESDSDDYWTWQQQKRRSDTSDFLATHSFLYRLIDAARRYGKRETYEHNQDGLDFIFRADSWWKTVLENPGATPGYQLTETAFADMKRTAAELDAKLVVLFFPFKEQVYWDIARRYTRDGDKISQEDIDAPVTAVMNFLDGENIDYCNLAPDLRSAAASGAAQLYLKAGAHWTATGNAEAAKSIAACLDRLGIGR